ncbi:MAG: YbjP/YqhG family protein [Xanthobacteraceae bacterium]|nr:YbjP/YqhG family protein [Xanthobacteraceae bacterium]
MPSRWLAALAALFLLVPAAQAQSPDAKTFVENIYKRYLGKNVPGLDLSTREALELYFTPSLADLIDKDAKEAEKQQEAPLLNGDPFVDAQDWEITDPAVTVQTQENGKGATATATFKNFGKTVTVRLALMLTPKGWRIDDVFWSEGNLRALYKPPQ